MEKFRLEEFELKLLNNYKHLSKLEAKIIIKQLFTYWENIIDNYKI